MAKSKRSNSPKRSRRGRRSPKKNKFNLQKKISKGEAEPSQLHELAGVEEEPDCACELTYNEDVQQELPKNADEVPVADLSTVKEDLVQFFWDSLEEDSRATMKLLSELPEQLFFFGKVTSELMKTGKSNIEVESKLAVVWKADEAWIRSFLAGEVELPKPEEPEEPEQIEQMEQPEDQAAEGAIVEEVEMAEIEAQPEVEMAEVEAQPEVEAAAEVVEPVEVPVEVSTEVEAAAMDYVVENSEILADESIENAINKENTADVIADAIKAVSSKHGETPVENAAAAEGLAPKDLNVVQPMELA